MENQSERTLPNFLIFASMEDLGFAVILYTEKKGIPTRVRKTSENTYRNRNRNRNEQQLTRTATATAILNRNVLKNLSQIRPQRQPQLQPQRRPQLWPQCSTATCQKINGYILDISQFLKDGTPLSYR